MIRRQIVVPVTPDRLWEALTDPIEVAGWFGGTLEWELREGAPLRFRGKDGAERDGRVDVVRPGRHLRFRWWPALESGSEEAAAGPPSQPGEASEVSYVLDRDREGTRLTVQERPLDERAADADDRPSSRTADRPTGRGPGRAEASVAGTARPGLPPGRLATRPSAPAAAWTTWDDRLALGWICLDAGGRVPVGARS